MPDYRWEVRVTIEDAKGRQSTHKFYLHRNHFYEHYNGPAPPAGTQPSAIDYIWDYALKLNYLVGGRIAKLRLTLAWGSVGLEIPESWSDVEAGLRVLYDTINPSSRRKLYTHTVPTFSEDYLYPETEDQLRRLLFVDPDVQAWGNLLLIAPTLGFPTNPCDRRGWVIETINDAFQTFKGSRS